MAGNTARPESVYVHPLCSDDSADGGRLQPGSADDLVRTEWLLARRAQLQCQLDMVKSDANRSGAQVPIENEKERYEKLKGELLERTVVKDSQELILRGEQLAMTVKSLLNIDEDSCGDTGAVHRKGVLENRIAEFTEVSSKVGKEHNELTVLRTELDDLKKKSFDLFQRSRQLHQEIAAQKRSKEDELRTLTTDPEGKRLREALQTKLQMNVIQCNVLQGLVYGSGLNWAQDPDLQTLVLVAGKPVVL